MDYSMLTIKERAKKQKEYLRKFKGKIAKDILIHTNGETK